jgi:hypothetical protein
LNHPRHLLNVSCVSSILVCSLALCRLFLCCSLASLCWFFLSFAGSLRFAGSFFFAGSLRFAFFFFACSLRFASFFSPLARLCGLSSLFRLRFY